jgi:hypothetical protein
MRQKPRRTSSLAAALLIAAMALAGIVVAVPGGVPQVLADDKKGTEKAQPKEVPAQCARLIKASDRQRCLQKSGS